MQATSDGISMGRLDRFASRIVLDWVTDEPERRWRVVEGTLVFADISGFTALSEKLATRGRIGTEELVETLSRVFGGMLGIAAQRGGQLLKFGGDALLLLFTGSDHARQAASAAVEMRSDLRRASQASTSVGKLTLKISIGAHSGAFHLFLVGDRYRQLVVGGPDTTVAMDAENAAEAGQIVVSERMADLLGRESTKLRDDGQLMVIWRKGAVDPVGAPDGRDTDPVAAAQVTPPIIATVFEQGAPDPVHRIATMAFLKFTGTDQRLAEDGPDALADDLHRTLEIAQAAFDAEDIALLYVDVDANGGKLFCSSGIPVTGDDDEGRMLRAARSIVDAEPPLALQVGIHRGHVFAGELGTRDQAVFSIMGDTVNTAARIMATAPAGVIHAHPAVLEMARTRYQTESQGPFTFKGKAQAQVVYRVGDELGPRESTDGHDLRFHGRDTELADLSARIDAVAAGHGDVVTLVGAAGLGKSRLIREALGSDHPRLLDMRAEPYGSSNSLRVVRDPLRGLFGLSGDDSSALVDALRHNVQQCAPQLEPYLPLIGDALQLPVPSTPEVDAIGPQYRPDRTADAVLELMEAVHDGPLVVVAEDMHWADDASAHLLGRIADATTSHPWLLIVARRDDEGGFAPESGDRIPVEPLPDDAVRALTINATEAAPLRPHEIDLVVERSAGSPMFVGELIAAAQELGSLDAVPKSLQGTLAAQVDALDPLSKRVLSYASVLGRSFRRAVVVELLRREGLELDQATIALLSRFIDADGPRRYKFRNGLVRDVVYDSLAYRVRARLHSEAGEAYEALSTGDDNEVAVLSLHFSNSGDHERAYRYARAAAERADRTFASAEAVIHYERAIDAARHLDDVSDDELRRLYVALGGARQDAGLYNDSLAAYRHAGRLASDDMVARAEIHLRRARARERAGALSLALGETTRGSKLTTDHVGPEGQRVHAQLLAHAAIVHYRQQHLGKARRTGLMAAELAERCGEREALATSCNVIFLAEAQLGRPGAESWAERALELYKELGDLQGQAATANNLGVIAFFESRWEETLERYREAVESDRRTGRLLGAALTEANIAEVLVSQGRLDEADPLLRHALRVLRASDDASVPFVEMHLGRLLTARGEYEDAERLLIGVNARWSAMGIAAAVYETSIHLADCLLQAGRAGEALDVLAQDYGAGPEETRKLVASRATVAARAHLDLGEIGEARERICSGLAAAREQSLTFDIARLLLVAARIGTPFDVCLETTEPVEQAERLLDQLGVLSDSAVVT